MMQQTLAFLIVGAVSVACGAEARAPVVHPDGAAAAGMIEAGRFAYVVDRMTRTCFLFVDWSGPDRPRRSVAYRVAGQVSCAKLKSALPEAARHVTWLEVAPTAEGSSD